MPDERLFDEETGEPKVYVSVQQFEVGGDGKVKFTKSNKGRRWSCGCLAFVILLPVLCIPLFIFVGLPLFKSGFGMEDTRPVPGDATHFDPISTYAQVANYAGVGVELVSIDAYYVRSDGTLDLTTDTYYPYVSYDFYREMSEPPEDAPPIGAGGTVDGKWYEPINIRAYQPGQWRSVSRVGGGVSMKYTYMNEGMQRETSDPVSQIYEEFAPTPTCSFKELWDVALTHDAPTNAVAIINYTAQGYTFSISDVSIYLDFDHDCKIKE